MGGIALKRWFGMLLAAVMLLGQGLQMPVHAEMPAVSAAACVLMEAATGRVLCEKASGEKRPMASTTKIMTTLLCLESGGLDEAFAVDNAAIHVEGSSMGLQENDIVTKRALCFGMLLPSGNDAANAAAVAVAGSIPDFLTLMNARAAEIGMTQTHFATPSGLEGEGHGASAYDMALLTREALRNEVFRDLCGRTSATVNFGNPPYARTLYNTNKLLGMYEGVSGVKTGFTDEAGRCLVSACERDGITLICVTLGAPDDWNDHMKLYDYGFSVVRPTVLDEPADLCQKVAGGTQGQVRLAAGETVCIGVPEGASDDVTCRVSQAPFVFAPVAKGDRLGTLTYLYENRIVAEVPLCAAESAAAMEKKQPSGSPLERLAAWVKGLWKAE